VSLRELIWSYALSPFQLASTIISRLSGPWHSSSITCYEYGYRKFNRCRGHIQEDSRLCAQRANTTHCHQTSTFISHQHWFTTLASFACVSIVDNSSVRIPESVHAAMSCRILGSLLIGLAFDLATSLVLPIHQTGICGRITKIGIAGVKQYNSACCRSVYRDIATS